MRDAFKFTKGPLGAGLILVATLSVDAQQQPPQQKPELEGMILLADGRRQRGFIQDTSKEGLLFALTERGPGNGYYWDTQVTAVAFDTANDIMRDARATFAQGNFEEAAERFGQVADGYANMAWVPNGFAAEARYYHVESLRRLNRFEEIAAALETPTGQAIESKLGEFYQSQHALNKVWAQVGGGQWESVKAAVESRQKPVVGNAELLPAPVFQKMAAREMVQLAYMRAKVHEAAGEDEKALDDYYRVFTLTFGNDRGLGMPAMEAVMAIHRKNPRLDDEKYKTPLFQMQSMAFLYKNSFGNGEIPSEFAEFAVKPDLPKPPEVKHEEDDEVAPPPAATEPGEKTEPAGDATPPAAADGDKKDGGDEPAAGGDGGDGGDKKDAAAAPAPPAEPKPAE